MRVPVIKDRFLFFSVLLAGIFYGLISLINHYCYRTYALDLGVYTNALYDYAHFSWNDSTAFKDVPENLLADHFDLYLPIISPLIFLFGTYTLLVVQIVAILLGGVGIYRYVSFKTDGNRSQARLALVCFFCFFGVFSATSFDYHSNVVATMFIPWFFLYFEQKKWKQTFVFFLLILVAKENMSLFLLFISLGLMLINWKDLAMRKTALIFTGISVVYFLVIIGLVMPSIANSGKYINFKYSSLGSNFIEAFAYIVSHPIETFKLLFINTSGNPEHDYVKLEMWIFFLLNGFLLFRRPAYLLMVLPIMAQKMLNDSDSMWGINYQYSVELAPIFIIGSFDVMNTIGNRRVKTTVGILLPLLVLGCSIRLMDNTTSYFEKAKIRIYKKAHYSREFPIDEANRVMNLIPEDTEVSAQSSFVPKLALRDKIHTFPTLGNSNYVVLSPVDNPFPMQPEEYAKKLQLLKNDFHWKVKYESSFFLVLEKK